MGRGAGPARAAAPILFRGAVVVMPPPKALKNSARDGGPHRSATKAAAIAAQVASSACSPLTTRDSWDSCIPMRLASQLWRRPSSWRIRLSGSWAERP